MHSLYNIDLFYTSVLFGYSIIFLVSVLLKRGARLISLSMSFLMVFGIQSYFSTYSQMFENITEMWKYYCFMFLLDGLLFLYISTRVTRGMLPYLAAVCIMSFLSFVLMFESYFTIGTTFIYNLYEIAIPTIHTYLLACLILGVGGGVKGICNNNSTGGASNSKTSKNSFGSLP